jgi:hypothetical protein
MVGKVNAHGGPQQVIVAVVASLKMTMMACCLLYARQVTRGCEHGNRIAEMLVNNSMRH